MTRPGHSVDGNQLREHLRKSVPYYMLPQHFVMLDAMPQTNNGKIDYKALPAPRAEAVVVENDQSEPTSPAEIFMIDLWSRVLEIDDVGLNDTFFDVGGHSLLAMKVISEVKDETGVKLGPQDFLVCTLQQLAEKIEASDVFVGTESNQEKTPAKSAVKTKSTPETKKATETSAELVAEVKANKENSKRKGLLRSLKGFWD